MTLLIVIRLFIIIVGFPLLFIKMIIVVMTCSLERGVWPRISEAGAITWESCICTGQGPSALVVVLHCGLAKHSTLKRLLYYIALCQP